MEDLDKKQYTFDDKGEVVIIKPVRVEVLPRDSNFEMKYNLRK
jgi:hypothetical protein